jgi:hypothetical protein
VAVLAYVGCFRSTYAGRERSSDALKRWRAEGLGGSSESGTSIKCSTPNKSEEMQVKPKQKAALCGAFAEPSDGLEPSTPSFQTGGQ